MATAPLAVQKAFDKQARLLSSNLRHPSVRAKKIDETRDIWQGRVNQAWRFFFNGRDSADEPNSVLGLCSQNIELVVIGCEDGCFQALGQLDGETVGQ